MCSPSSTVKKIDILHKHYNHFYYIWTDNKIFKKIHRLQVEFTLKRSKYEEQLPQSLNTIETRISEKNMKFIY